MQIYQRECPYAHTHYGIEREIYYTAAAAAAFDHRYSQPETLEWWYSCSTCRRQIDGRATTAWRLQQHHENHPLHRKYEPASSLEAQMDSSLPLQHYPPEPRTVDVAVVGVGVVAASAAALMVATADPSIPTPLLVLVAVVAVVAVLALPKMTHSSSQHYRHHP